MADRTEQAKRDVQPTAGRSLLKVATFGSDDGGRRALIGLLTENRNAAVRSFVVADAPGCEQFARYIAIGGTGSHADLAIILIDADKGIGTRTRRDATICSLFGIRAVVLAIDRIDLAGFEQALFEHIAGEFRRFATTLGFRTIVPIPVSTSNGDNVAAAGPGMPWYRGPALLRCLESIEVTSDIADKPFRFSVQSVDRSSSGICGTVASGRMRPGDPVVIAASGASSRVARIVAADRNVQDAAAGDAVTLTLSDELAVDRGDLLVPPAERPSVADQFAAHILWMDAEPLLPGRSYWLQVGTARLRATVSSIKYRLDVERLDHLAARQLEVSDIGFCNVSASQPVAFDSFAENRETGAFVLTERDSNRMVGVGTIAFALYRASNIHFERLAVAKEDRARAKHQRPCILWLTGLPAAGKSSIARLVEAALHAKGCHTYMLDGDNIRHGLTRDLGFTDADRVENIRRIGEVARLFIDAGLIVLCAFISPFRAERQMVRELVGEGEFIEIFVDTPLAECERRDPKGLYAKARSGAIRNFTGVDSAYEPPPTPELVLRTAEESAAQLAERVVAHLRAGGYIG